jgi:thymidylate synthase (FAD)
MKIIREPKVYLLAKPDFCVKNADTFLLDEERPVVPAWMGEGDVQALVETAGRICYMSYGKGRKTNEEFVRNIIASEHYSVLEHANWSLIVTGVSRSLSHEFVRHRHFSYSQLSQRYVDSKDVAFVLPPGLEGVGKAVWERACQEALKAYEDVVGAIDIDDYWNGSPTQVRKQVRQIARSVLPNATETKFVVTGNARSWREFFEKRGTIHADVEIRRLAVKILEVLKKEAPTIFEDFNVNSEGVIEHGKPAIAAIGNV